MRIGLNVRSCGALNDALTAGLRTSPTPDRKNFNAFAVDLSTRKLPFGSEKKTRHRNQTPDDETSGRSEGRRNRKKQRPERRPRKTKGTCTGATERLSDRRDDNRERANPEKNFFSGNTRSVPPWNLFGRRRNASGQSLLFSRLTLCSPSAGSRVPTASLGSQFAQSPAPSVVGPAGGSFWSLLGMKKVLFK